MKPVVCKVALKVIKLGMDTREVIARFEAERQALAMMDHPNIAKVLDAGATDAGRPYFVMELVKGIPITQYGDERQLSLRDRLALFGDVCSALNHAHQKGVIHRDIKPSNVMITLHGDKPVVKVIDFGIAKATQGKLTDKTLFTRFEQFIGTPVYMSPEQANLSGLDIDTRSDIYALGILLYELLTGKPPFDSKSLAAAGYEEMRRIIREVEPPRPSMRLSTIAGDERTQVAKARHLAPEKLSRLVETDLDWIVMKAIDKDRSRRYETANGLALDIQRFLSDEPVSATPPSTGYQLRKFARRNKAALRLVVGFAVVLVMATAVSSWQAVRATRADNAEALQRRVAESASKKERLARLDAEARRVEAEHQKARAEAGEKAAQEEKQIAQAVRDFLQTKLLRQADPEIQAEAIRQDGGLTAMAPNPTIRELLDRAANELTADKIETNFPNEPLVQAEILRTVGRTYAGVGEYDRAINFLRRAADLYQKRVGLDHPGTLENMDDLAFAYRYSGKLDLALPLIEETLKFRKAKLGPDHPNTLASMENLAVAYQEAGKLDLALPLFEQTLKLRTATLGPEHRRTLLAMSNLGCAYSEAGKRDLALPLLEESLKLRKAQLGPEAYETLWSMYRLADAYRDAGKLDLALPLLEEAFKLQTAKLGPEHRDTLLTRAGLGLAYRDAGKLDLALPLVEQKLSINIA